MRRALLLVLAGVASAAAVVLVGAPGAASSASEQTFRARMETVARLAPSLPFSGESSMDCGWAVGMCSVPVVTSTHRESAAPNGGHARKLYRLWSSEPMSHGSSPIGRIVVKDAWHSRAVSAAEGMQALSGLWRPFPPSGSSFEPCTTPVLRGGDGSFYRADGRAGLFVMMKLDPQTPGTDDGWIYGTVSTSGQVTQAGRIEECVGCHRTAPYDHTFSSR